VRFSINGSLRLNLNSRLYSINVSGEIMLTHTIVQRSPEWHAYRLAHDNASDAPAMMGVSSYKTRSQLIEERATGIIPDVDEATQRRFDDGHRFEELARPLAEAIIGEELYPVTGSLEGTRLSASFDGITLLEDVAWEHKTLSQRLRDVLSKPGCTGADLPIEYQVQLEQQCAVSGCERILFMATKWTEDGELIEEMHCWYTPNNELRARIIAGWEQFHKDVEAYVRPAPAPLPVIAEAMESLPAVSVRLEGKLAVVSNLPAFSVALREFIERIPSAPETDQEFAIAESACKALKRAEDALKAGEDAAIGELADFEEMRRQVRDLKEMARTTRLATEKLVSARKEQLRSNIVFSGVKALRDHIDALNARIGKPYMPQVPADFGGAVKGKRTIESLLGAMNDELARCKIAANEIAYRIQTNLHALRDIASGNEFLFADEATIVLKQPDDFAMLVKSRIAEHQAAEQKRLEAERERIRAEEVARLQREAEAAELARKQREEEAKALAEATAIVEHAQAAINDDDVVDAEFFNKENASTGERVSTTMLKLGQINERLAPICISAYDLSMLGFKHLASEKTAKLYRECDFPSICDALVRHIMDVKARYSAD
jgi:predicted phage-related endonuclease